MTKLIFFLPKILPKSAKFLHRDPLHFVTLPSGLKVGLGWMSKWILPKKITKICQFFAVDMSVTSTWYFATLSLGLKVGGGWMSKWVQCNRSGQASSNLPSFWWKREIASTDKHRYCICTKFAIVFVVHLICNCICVYYICFQTSLAFDTKERDCINWYCICICSTFVFVQRVTWWQSCLNYSCWLDALIFSLRSFSWRFICPVGQYMQKSMVKVWNSGQFIHQENLSVYVFLIH